MADLFEPSVAAAVASIRAQIEASQGVVKVSLTGGSLIQSFNSGTSPSG